MKPFCWKPLKVEIQDAVLVISISVTVPLYVCVCANASVCFPVISFLINSARSRCVECPGCRYNFIVWFRVKKFFFCQRQWARAGVIVHCTQTVTRSQVFLFHFVLFWFLQRLFQALLINNRNGRKKNNFFQHRFNLLSLCFYYLIY